MERIRAKKSLGQNFLKSKKALDAMVAAGNVSAADTILEIGPGQGALTEKLLSTGAHVVAVEKDDRLIGVLKEKFSKEIAAGRFELIHGDILDLNLDFLKAHRYKLIANIPYYITGLIFRRFLETGPQPSAIVILVQKEIADRIVARDGKESLLSVSVKCYGAPQKIMKVGKEHFSPAPKVDSAILAITGISKDFFSSAGEAGAPIGERRFFDTLKAGFAHKRKMLAANLKGVLRDPAGTFAACGIPARVRAEDLSPADWRRIAAH